MKEFYRSRVLVSGLAALVLLGAAWVDAMICTTTFRWRDLTVKHFAPGVDVIYFRKSLGWQPTETTREVRENLRMRFEMLPQVRWKVGSDEAFVLRIPWGGIWVVFLVWWGTALRQKWLQVKERRAG